MDGVRAERGSAAAEGRLANATGRSRALLMAAMTLAALGLAVYGWRWWSVGRFLESTDDAYLQADNVTIAPKVGGIVATVAVDDNQAIKAGDTLVQIDDRDYRAAVDQARGTVAAGDADIRNLDAQEALQRSLIVEADADLASAQAALRFADQEYKRFSALVHGGAGTVQRVEQAEADLRSRTAQLDHARANAAAARQQLDVIRSQRQRAEAMLTADRARLAQAELDLEHTRLVAPVDGVVGDRSVRAGQFVQPGTRLLTVVPMSDIYLTANFKETQLARMRPGQKVEVELDTFPGEPIGGTVASLAPGSGSQFALLPPENATGNFTKIVQRVPVKIRLDAVSPLAGRLRPGLSVTATVDTRDRAR
jgi:membrane fusion protein (multidrug efflux system)